MARIARVVASGIPHHIIQRGNRRQRTFFERKDYLEYINLMSEWCGKCAIEIWGYCLMDNHVHLIAVPKEGDDMAKGIGEAHRRYTRMINFRKKWRGYLWQGRFLSYPMDEEYLIKVVRYIENNPVKAGICRRAEDYIWSSAKAHKKGEDDKLVKVKPILERIGIWKEFMQEKNDMEDEKKINLCESTGRPLGSIDFNKKLEKLLGRKLTREKPGPKNN